MNAKLLNLTYGLLLILLAACGGGGGGGGGDPLPGGTPTLNLSFAAKELRFSWAAVEGATFYRLLENPDGASGFSQVAGNLTGLSHNHGIAVHRRVNASYRLDACNSAGCRSSAIVTPGTNLTQAIGFVKSLNTGQDDEFGVSVALSADGDTLAVGAWMESSSTPGVNVTPNDLAQWAGAVYVFTRTASGWSQQAFIKASNPDAQDGFGFAVSLSADGNTLAVGAHREDSSSAGVNNTSDNAATQAGAAYVFARTAGVWAQQAYLKASNTGPGDEFGFSVALSGDGNTLAVGAHMEDSSSAATPDDNAADAGAAYVFTRTGTVWTQQAYLKGTNTAAGDGFGHSVALSTDGNTLAVGAHLEDSGSATVPDDLAADAGATYVFTRSGATWSEQAYVKPSNIGAGDQFGYAVSLSGDGNTLAVGAHLEDSSTTSVNSTPNESGGNNGAAYVFVRASGAWSQQAYIKASVGGNERLGNAVALSADGNSLVVGVEGEGSSTTGVNSTRDNASIFAGAAYVFVRSGGNWSRQAYLKASNTGAGDTFGVSVAINGDGNTVAVGAELEGSSGTGIGSTPNEAAPFSGAVYLY